MNHWYDWVFWIFFGAGILFIIGIIVRLIVGAFRKPKPFAPTYDPTANRSTSSEDTTWGVGGTDSSTGFDAVSGGNDSGGGSSGGWND